MKYEIEIRRRAEINLSLIPQSNVQKIAARFSLRKKDYVRTQADLEDYYELLKLRKAKADSRSQKDRACAEAAKEIGLKKKD